MKIAIIGTRGIPNNYGGFEQFAERISVDLVNRGHEVAVYSPHFHNFKESYFKGVQIIRISSPEKLLHGIANFIYDNRCIKDTINKQFDTVLLCGYPTAIFSLSKMIKSKKTIFTINVDGLEWSRSRWNLITRNFIKWAEKKLVKSTLKLITDHHLINKYYSEEYSKRTQYIPYGADITVNFNENVLSKYNLIKNEYFISVSRIEKDNNLEIIIDGFLQSKSKQKFIIIGNYNTLFGKKIKQKYSQQANIIFLGAIYDMNILNNLRYFSSMYFHGHSVGGTNPSLLEAMASEAFIIAHENIYNKSILEKNALYFTSTNDIKNIINTLSKITKNKNNFRKNNLEKIKTEFSWEIVVNQYEKAFKSLIK